MNTPTKKQNIEHPPVHRRQTSDQPAIVFTELPPALTQKQAVLFMGVSQSVVSDFMKKHKDCIQYDQAGRRRIKKRWAEAYTMGAIDELGRIERGFL